MESEAGRFIERLEKAGAPLFFPDGSRVESVLYALETLVLRRFVQQSEGLYRAAPGNVEVLGYYANSLAHWNDRNEG